MKNTRIKGFVQPALYLLRFRSRTSIVATAAAGTTSSSAFFLFNSRHYVAAATVVEDQAQLAEPVKESPGISYGLNLALAGRGVIVKDKAFYNLKSFELKQKGAIDAEIVSDLPVYVRKDVIGGASEISKAQFRKLLEKVTAHLSSISNVFVHDGAVGSSSYCDAKVRIISDSPSAVLSLHKFLWKTSPRAVSHDSCPLTVYVASDISPNTGEILGLGSKLSIGFAAADIERSSLILCGKAFSDTNSVKKAVAALAGPIISARDGLPLPASCETLFKFRLYSCIIIPYP